MAEGQFVFRSARGGVCTPRRPSAHGHHRSRRPNDGDALTDVRRTGEAPDLWFASRAGSASVDPPSSSQPTEVSSPYQLLPPLSADEFEELKADIALRGVLIPVEIDA